MAEQQLKSKPNANIESQDRKRKRQKEQKKSPYLKVPSATKLFFATRVALDHICVLNEFFHFKKNS